jgi:hypothetical protein
MLIPTRAYPDAPGFATVSLAALAAPLAFGMSRAERCQV